MLKFMDLLFIHPTLLTIVRSEASRKASLVIRSSQRVENMNINVGLLMMNSYPKNPEPSHQGEYHTQHLRLAVVSVV